MTSRLLPTISATALFAAVPMTLVAGYAYGADFMTADDAQHLMFPGATSFEPVLLSADPATLKALDITPGALATTRFFTVKQGDQVLGSFALDAVIGKFQLINYAVSFDAQGAIKDIEILAYREAHGAEVRNASWRQQFVGKKASAPLRVGDDIDNISGATLSCSHLTDGIRKLSKLIAQSPAHA